MIVEEIEKAWAARGIAAPFFPTPAFVGDKLMLGAGTELAQATLDPPTLKKDSWTRDARLTALLAAAFRRPIGDRARAHFRRALHKRVKGDDLAASLHLALMGLPRLDCKQGAARRLFAADRLMHAGVTPETIFVALDLDPTPLRELIRQYDPDQPRVPARSGPTSGQWTADDGAQEESAPSQGSADRASANDHSQESASRAGALAVASATRSAGAGLAEAGSFFAENVAPRALAALAQLALRAAGPVALFGLLVVPWDSKRPVVEGMVPGRSDLRYEWLQDDGLLLLHRLINGQWVTVTQGHMDLQGVFRDRAGEPFARVINQALAIDVATMSRAEEDEKDQASAAGTVVTAIARAKEEPKLCPDPIEETSDDWSANSREYQTKVTGLPPPLAIFFNHQFFDGCDEERGGLLLQATADRDQFLGSNNDWMTWFDGGLQIAAEIDRSYEASSGEGRRVEWHAQKKRVADWISAYLSLSEFVKIHRVQRSTHMLPRKYEVTSRWGSRPETAESCARRFAKMIDGLAMTETVFGGWRKLGSTLASAQDRFCKTPADIAELTQIFDQSREYYDLPKRLWPEMGFSFGCWNGRNPPCGTNMRVRCGAYGPSPKMANDIMIGVSERPRNDVEWTAAELRRVLNVVIDAWGPSEAAVIYYPYFEFAPRSVPDNPTYSSVPLSPFVGWITYVPRPNASLIVAPDGVDVEQTSHGNLYTLCEEPFTTNNPVHLARAAAMERALSPIRSNQI
jgi:hypothetical protein